MIGRFFLDTNVLFYAEDPRDLKKQQKARELIRLSFLGSSARISLQVLQEFFSSTTKKLGLPTDDARRRIELYSAQIEVVQLEPGDLLDAIDLHRDHKLSIWDSLVVRAALMSKCQILYTEDLHHGLEVQGLRVVNPFAD